MLTSNKDLKKILKTAEQEGWCFRPSGRNHIKGRHTDGRTTTIPGTPSDVKCHYQIKKYLGLPK